MRFAILGPIAVRAGDRAVSLGGPRQVALLALLALHANRAVSSDQLHDTLWAAQEPGGAPKRLQMAVARLRKSLAPLDGGPDRCPPLRTVSGGYMLVVAPGELDSQLFQDGVTDGRALLDGGDACAAAGVLRAALALWRGPALAEVAFEDFAQPEIRRLQELRAAGLEARIEADLALGRHDAVVGELQTLVAEHPGRERFCELLMLALYRCGRQTDALDAFHCLDAHLVGELGLRAGPALRTLQRAVLEQAAWLTGGPGPRVRGDAPSESATGTTGAFALPPALQSAEPGPLVGRVAALARLTDAYGRAASGARQLVLLRGEPGVGKTRLATEFARHAHAGGAIVLFGRCDEESLLAHQPFVEALRQYVCNCSAAVLGTQVQLISGELRRVVPELAERVPQLGHPLAGDPEGARHRLFEAIGALLCEAAQEQPLVLVLDDLHWADTATLVLLKYVARYPRASRLMIVGTYREMDVASDHALNNVLTELGRDRLVEGLALERLDEAAVSELVSWHTGNRAPADLRRLIYEETDGLAFFVVEFSRHLGESRLAGAPDGDREATPPPNRLALPEGVKALVRSRLARLGPRINHVLQTASAVGQAFAFEILERLCDLGQDELVDALDAAVRAQLIRQPAAGDSRYAFSHALIRDVLYEALTTTRRTLLHRRVAATLEEVRGGDADPRYAELAHHLGQAGAAEDLRRAVAYAVLAGERALAMLAYEQAAAHYRQAIEMLDGGGASGSAAERCDLTIARGEAERMAGDPAHRETLLRAAGLALDAGDVDRLARAALANTRGFNSSAQGVDRERVAVLRAALALLGDDDSAARAGVLGQLAVELIADADWQRRSQLADEALEMARRVGDDATLARVLTQAAVAQLGPSTLSTRRAQLREAVRLADRAGERLLASHAAYFGCKWALEAGDMEQADTLLERLGSLVEPLGLPIVEWYEADARACLCIVTGSPKCAEQLAVAAYGLARRAGQPDADVWVLGHIHAARLLQGTLDHVEPDILKMFEVPGSAPVVGPEFEPGPAMALLVGAGMSAILCEVGRPHDARAHFDLLMDNLAELPDDWSTLSTLASAAIGCGHLRDAANARRLHALLEPFAGQFVNSGASWLGAVDHHLAVLCAPMGRLDEADERFASAERAYERLGADAWLARCRLDWSSLLLERAGDDDAEHAAALVAEALATARRLGLDVIEKRALLLGRQGEPDRRVRR